MPGRIVHLFQVQLDGLGQARAAPRRACALAGHVNIQALGNVPVPFLVQRYSASSRYVRHGPRKAARFTPPTEPRSTRSAPTGTPTAGSASCVQNIHSGAALRAQAHADPTRISRLHVRVLHAC